MKLLLCSSGYSIGEASNGNKIIINNFDGVNQRVLEKNDKIKNIDIKIIGKNNRVFIDGRSNWRESKIFIEGNENIIEIKKTNYTNKIEINMPKFNGIESNGRKVVIGENCYIGSMYLMCALSNEKVLIGDNCFFSSNIHLRTSDAHVIYDIDSKEALNDGQNDVVIEKHCWIGEGAFISKGTYLNENTIVGAGAFISKKINEKNQILAGVPARVIKSNVNWDKMNTEAYLRHMKLQKGG